MAGTFTANPKNAALAPVVRQCGVIALTVVTAGLTYATGAGGFQLALATLFTAGQGLTYQKGIQPGDIVAITGYTNDGFLAFGVTDATTPTTLDIRLFTSGGSEIADSTYTKTLTLLIFVAGNAYN